MPAMIQIRHVPGALHRKLKARAALAGMSLSSYLLRELERVAERPTLDEMLGRLRLRSPVDPHLDPTRMVREERDSR